MEAEFGDVHLFTCEIKPAILKINPEKCLERTT